MDLVRVGEYSLHMKHRHNDDTWGTFEPVPSHHSPADHDPEREWASGTLYRCTTCDEEVLVDAGKDPEPPI